MIVHDDLNHFEQPETDTFVDSEWVQGKIIFGSRYANDLMKFVLKKLDTQTLGTLVSMLSLQCFQYPNLTLWELADGHFNLLQECRVISLLDFCLEPHELPSLMFPAMEELHLRNKNNLRLYSQQLDETFQIDMTKRAEQTSKPSYQK